MKKGLMIGLVVGVLLSAATFFVYPVLAQQGGPNVNDGWQQLHEACQNGDFSGGQGFCGGGAGGAGGCGGYGSGAPAPTSTPGQRTRFGGMMGGWQSW